MKIKEVSKLAYLKESIKDIEVDFPIASIWEAIPKAVAALEWDLLEKNQNTHKIVVRTRDSLTSYDSILTINISKINEKTSNLAIGTETPVTTITSTLDYCQNDERVDELVLTLAEIMNQH